MRVLRASTFLFWGFSITTASVRRAEMGRFGKHAFPDPTGKVANEFQVINHHTIRDRRGERKSTSSDDASYEITSVSPTLIDNDDVVTVEYTSSRPNSGDWIAAYSPPDVSITDTAPVKYGYCDEADDYLSTGEGFLTFNLTNLRSDVKFVFYTNGLQYPEAMNESTSDQVVQFRDINQPLRPRVVATGDYDVFNLVWSSATSTSPVLRWSATPGGSSSSNNNNNGDADYVQVAAATTNITQDMMCGSPAVDYGWREQGLIHTASFSGMKQYAAQSIYYQFGDLDTDDFSEEFELHLPPLPGVSTQTNIEAEVAADIRGILDDAGIDSSTWDASSTVRPTSLILYDDLGRGSTDMTYTWNEYGRPSVYTLRSVGALVDAGKVDAIYHGGDISYATGYMAVWDFYLDMISPVAAAIPYFTTVGNHESDWYDSASLWSNADSGGECGIPATVLLPEPAPAQTNAPWWSYDVGMIHMIGMSTEHDFYIGSDQYNWLAADLAAVDRTVTPWIVFGGHRAMYLNSDYNDGETSDGALMDDLITNIEPLLYQYRVNIGFYGHNHVVQRHSAVLNRTVIQPSQVLTNKNGYPVYVHKNPQATVQMVVGTGGAAFTVNYVTPYPAWNEMVMYEWGYARVVAVNETHLVWLWVKSETNEVLDRMVIIQDDPTQPWDAEAQKAQYQSADANRKHSLRGRI